MRVNGEDIAIGSGCSLKDFLTNAGYPFERIAVELNGKVIPKTQYEVVILSESDRLEIVSFVGGG